MEWYGHVSNWVKLGSRVVTVDTAGFCKEEVNATSTFCYEYI